MAIRNHSDMTSTATNTELSKFIWNLKDNEKAYKIKWSIAAQARAYSSESKRCNLCLSEKLFIGCFYTG